MLNKWLVFVEGHVRFIGVVGVLVVVFVLFNKYEGHRHDEAVAAEVAAKAQLDEQIKKNEILAGQVSSASQAYSQLATQMNKANAALKQEIASLSQKLQLQQQADDSMTLADLADRWSALIGAGTADIQAVDGDTVSVSGQSAHKTVSQLEMIEPLHQEVLAGHQVEDNLNKQLTGLNNVNTAQAAQITGLQTQLVKADESCKAQLKVAKPTFFGKVKSALKQVGVGIGIGFALGHKF